MTWIFLRDLWAITRDSAVVAKMKLDFDDLITVLYFVVVKQYIISRNSTPPKFISAFGPEYFRFELSSN
jgi:hypothetical protein